MIRKGFCSWLIQLITIAGISISSCYGTEMGAVSRRSLEVITSSPPGLNTKWSPREREYIPHANENAQTQIAQTQIDPKEVQKTKKRIPAAPTTPQIQNEPTPQPTPQPIQEPAPIPKASIQKAQGHLHALTTRPIEEEKETGCQRNRPPLPETGLTGTAFKWESKNKSLIGRGSQREVQEQIKNQVLSYLNAKPISRAQTNQDTNQPTDPIASANPNTSPLHIEPQPSFAIALPPSTPNPTPAPLPVAAAIPPPLPHKPIEEPTKATLTSTPIPVKEIKSTPKIIPEPIKEPIPKSVIPPAPEPTPELLPPEPITPATSSLPPTTKDPASSLSSGKVRPFQKQEATDASKQLPSVGVALTHTASKKPTFQQGTNDARNKDEIAQNFVRPPKQHLPFRYPENPILEDEVAQALPSQALPNSSAASIPAKPSSNLQTIGSLPTA